MKRVNVQVYLTMTPQLSHVPLPSHGDVMEVLLMEVLFNLCLIAEYLLCWGWWERAKEMFYLCLCC